MKINFLGTGTSQGIPVIGSDHPVCLSLDKKDKRLRTSILLDWEGIQIIIDCGPDFRHQMLRSNCSKIDTILFTHEHNDHVSGLDDIRPFYFKYGTIPIYAERRVINSLTQRFPYIFNNINKTSSVPSVKTNEIIDQFIFKNKIVIPIRAFHGQLPILGYRFADFAYFTDVKIIQEPELKKLKNLKVLVINALRIEEHKSHLNLEDAIALIQRINPKKAYLTHVSHKLGFHKEIQRSLPKNIFLAYDELEIEIN
tara:strand:- start:14098 stop:14859 length:762 start_codon:yes stop_codon:yes gene_type:complete